MREIKIGEKYVGRGHKVFIVFELGVCHEQNLELAKNFISAAAKSGADAVKVEAFQADELVLDKEIEHTFGTYKGDITENYYELLKRLELSYEDFGILKNHADDSGILFFPTVHTREAVDYFSELDVCAFKTCSPDIINKPLMRYIASKGKPLFVDSGGAYLGEIEAALNTLEMENFKDVIVMHNPSGYPAPPEKTDLRMIPAIQEAFEIPVGLSCHTPGFDMCIASLAMGANVIEKPISRNMNVCSPEHNFSFLVSESDSFVNRLRMLEIALGNKRRHTVPHNSLGRYIGRRGIYAANNIGENEVLEEKSLQLAKPWKGISVEFIDEIIGKKARRKIIQGEPITWIDLK